MTAGGRIRRYATGDGEGAQSSAKRGCPVEENGGRAGCRYGYFEGSREGKIVNLERLWQTIAEVRCRLGLQKVLEHRACRLLDQPRSTQR